MYRPWWWALRSPNISGRSIAGTCLSICSVILPLLLLVSHPAQATSSKPKIEIEKHATDAVANDDGTFTTTFTLETTNTGREELVELQLKDDLDIFGSKGALVSIGQRRVLRGPLKLNSHYDGLHDIKLLKGTDRLKPGKSVKLAFDVTFTVENTSKRCPFTNKAIAWSAGKHSGKDADEYDRAKICLPLEPEIEIEKHASEAVANDDGSYTTTFTLEATNTGNEELVELQLKDDLDIFGSKGALVSIGERRVLRGPLKLNSHYDGIHDIRLLKGTDRLKPGKSVKLTFDVTFSVDNVNKRCPFTNKAIAWSAGKHSGKDADEYDRAKICLPLEPKIEIEKHATEAVANGDGSFTTTFTLEATNTGNEELVELQLKDDLDIFGSEGALVSIGERRVLRGPLKLNSHYDGIHDIRLLKGTDRLKPGKSVKLAFDVTFTVENTSKRCPFTNKAIAWSAGKHSGKDADEYDRAKICLPLEPKIEIEKHATEAVANGDGSFTTTFTMEATNTGNEELVELQLKDDLDIFGPKGTLVAISDRRVLEGPLTLNPDYDGVSDIRLLTGVDRLEVGKRVKLAFEVTFTVEGATEQCPFTNKAIAWSAGKHSGKDADEYDRAKICLPLEPKIEIEKYASEAVANDDGSYTTTFTLEATNTGNEELVELQLKDDLDIFGPKGTLVAISDRRVLEGPLTLNPDYDGVSDIRLLTGVDRLEVGKRVKLAFEVTFTVEGATEQCPFTNKAIAWSAGKHSGKDADEYDRAKICLPFEPKIEIEKHASEAVANDDGSYTTTFTLEAANTGNEELVELQLKDDLDIFGPKGTLVAISDRRVLEGPLTLNPDYDGVSDIRLLTGVDRLEVGKHVKLAFDVTFTVAGATEQCPFTNKAIAWSVGRHSHKDADDHDSAPVCLPLTPGLVLTKTAGAVMANGDGTFSVPLELTVTNVGAALLTSLQLTDDLATFVGGGGVVSVETLSSATLSVNPNYDGVSDVELLAGTDSLSVGASASVTFTVVFTVAAGSCPTTLTNTGLATATLSSTGELSTTSASVTIDCPEVVDPEPALELIKTAGAVMANGDGTFSVPLELTVTNVGAALLTSLQLTDDLATFVGGGGVVSVETLSSATLSVNPNYDGVSDVELLAGTDSLSVGASASVTFTVVFTVAAGSCPTTLTNTGLATATLSSTGELSTTSASVTIDCPEVVDPEPALELIKTAGAVMANGDGTFSVPLELTVTNVGAALLTSLQLTDDLATFVGGGGVVSVETLSSATLSVNPNYDGVSDVELLAGTDSLSVGASASVTFTVVFTVAAGSCPTTLTNTGLATATLSSTGELSTTSASVTIDCPEVVDPEPALELIKTAGAVMANGDGTFSVPLELTVTNVGAALLTSLQLTDDLATFVGGGGVVSVETLSSATLSVNPNYDGVSDVELLAGTDSLSVGASASVTFTVVFTVAAGSCPTTLTNTGLATATLSSTGELSTTSASVTIDCPEVVDPEPALELIKTAGAVMANGDGTFSVPLELTVTNVGAALLTSLQLTDDLATFVGGGGVVSVETLSSATLSVNPNYDGVSDVELLAGTDSLSVGASASVTFTVVFTVAAGSCPTTLTNTGLATATLSSTGELSTTSASVTIDDPRCVEPPSFTPVISISKSANRTLVLRGESVGYDIIVSNPSNVACFGNVVSDNLPAGFQLVDRNSAVLVLPGPDGLFGTGDDRVRPIASEGADPVVFEPFDLAPNERALLRYSTRVGTGVSNGEHTNIATVTPLVCKPATASATVALLADPIFEKSTIIGKVFDDRNGDTWQDPDEPGIAGVRLMTVSGITIETDAHGRYHLADVDAGRFERGSNFIIKVDVATLPQGATIISPNPRVIRLAQATVSKINFAVDLPKRGGELCFESCRTETLQVVHTVVNPTRCIASGATNYAPNWGRSLRPSDSDGAGPECVVHTGFPERSATAREIRVSGGAFGCSTLVASVLPGRPFDGDPGPDSEVTVFASQLAANSTRVRGDTDDECDREGLGDNIELTTEQGSRLWITGAGDVIRKGDPDNAEHIVVTPFRDETDSSVITALRVVNDGIDPIPDTSELFPGHRSASASAKWTGDPLTVDPRLDVLALDRPMVELSGQLSRPIRFAMYTNYGRYIRSYALEIYGSSGDGFTRKHLQTLPAPDFRFKRPFVFDGAKLDLSDYAELEYVLKASSCSGSFDLRDCHVDVTNARLLALPRSDTANTSLHQAHEVWGKSNLAIQRIPVVGGRARIQGMTNPDLSNIRINGRDVPVDEDGAYVLEEHLPFGAHRLAFEDDRLPESGPQGASADANEVTVSGAHFGCNEVVVDTLPGRETKNDERIMAITVVADSRRRAVFADQCPGIVKDGNGENYAVVVRTGEGSVVGVTSAGDVRQIGHPPTGTNYQQVVVTPFRDHTDSTMVSALRIVNEGFPYIPEKLAASEETVLENQFTDDYLAIVALANLTIGNNNVSGNVESLAADDHFDETVYTDGRVALYAKGKIKGRYLLTAQLDSTEDELRNLTDNLKRKDPRRIFRQLDPDRYYPVYGDDSTATTDVDSQGAFYVRVDWDKSTALWGNYNTGMTDTEFMQYNRSLYGAKLRHENRNATQYGDARTELTLFGSEAQSVAAHVTFQATGGSLYYLRHTDIVEGSEKAWIEVRRRGTQHVVEREVLIEGRDYEVDAIQGRIILSRPLSQVVNDRGPAIIRSTPLEGDDVFLLVDYEYVPDAFVGDDLTHGGRGKVWLGDHVAVGATSVTDKRDGADYALSGIDLTLRAGEGTYLTAEFAHSEARQSDSNLVSVDGGLSFESQISGGSDGSLEGDAVAVEARVSLDEFSELLAGDVRAWWKQRDTNFSTGRLGQGRDTTDSGLEANVKFDDRLTVIAAYNEFNREGLSTERVARVQAEGRLGRVTAGMEVRHEQVERAAGSPPGEVSSLNAADADGEALLVGARLGYGISEDTTVFARAQTVADERGTYDANDLVGIGVNTRLIGDLGLSLEASDGDRGSALTAGIELARGDGLNFNVSGGMGSGAVNQFATRYSLKEGHELYGSYAVDPDRTEGDRNLLTLGQRRAFGNHLGVFTESQFGKGDQYASVGHVFGLDFDGIADWRFSGTLQASENDKLGRAFDRRAVSLGAYLERASMKFSSKVEYREDKGVGTHNRQYVTSNSLTRRIDESRRWIGQLNLSWTEDELNGGHDARFAEFDIGYSHRPVTNDRLNVLAKYSFLYDLPTEGQATARPDERSHVVALEGIYDVSLRWELAGKLAVKKGAVRSARDAGPWRDFGLRLAAVRGRYHINKKWDGLAEYRWLSDIDGNNSRRGALLAVYRQVGEHFKIGAGFNFTDFNDDLKLDGYNHRGWFLDLVGKY